MATAMCAAGRKHAPKRAARPHACARARARGVCGCGTRTRAWPWHRHGHAQGPLPGKVSGAALAVALSLVLQSPAEARLEGVNKPELLPKRFTPVIDVADFLTSGEEARLVERVKDLEKETGVKLRVLAQNYPETPGLAIKDYWKVDPQTVVFVADPNTGNIANFNVGDDVDLQVPRVRPVHLL